MKIGIITIHNSPNYGACLQSYALFAFLKQEGFDCEVIDLHRPTHKDYVVSKKYVASRTKKVGLLKGFLHKLKIMLSKNAKTSKALTPKAQERFDVFNSKIQLSQPFCGIDALYHNPPRYDVYIAGSDQLWNPTIGFCNEPYFLTFVKNEGKKISYATSIGVNELKDLEKNNYKLWLSEFSHISVREKSAKELLSSFVDKEIQQVADPTFLLDRTYWKEMSVSHQSSESYILLFTLSYSEILLEFALRMSNESGKKLIYLCLNQRSGQMAKNYEPIDDAGPKEWLGYIAGADMVITDSFHGTVFSIIMETPNFISYVPSTQKRGIRIFDLLNTFGLQSHIFNESKLNDSYDMFDGLKIDWALVNNVYLAEQQRSRMYLLSAIKD